MQPEQASQYRYCISSIIWNRRYGSQRSLKPITPCNMSDVEQNDNDSILAGLDPHYDLLPAAKEGGKEITPAESRVALKGHELSGYLRNWPIDNNDKQLDFNKRALQMANQGGLININPLIASSNSLSDALGELGIAAIPTPNSIPSDVPRPLPDHYLLHFDSDPEDNGSDVDPPVGEGNFGSKGAIPKNVTFMGQESYDPEDDDIFEEVENESGKESVAGGPYAEGTINKEKYGATELHLLTQVVSACLNPFMDRMSRTIAALETSIAKCEESISTLHAKMDNINTNQIKMGTDIMAAAADISAIRAKINYQPVSAAVVPPVGVHQTSKRSVTMPDLGSIKMWIFATFETQSPSLDSLVSVLKLKSTWVQKAHHSLVPSILDNKQFVEYLVLVTLVRSKDFRAANQELFEAFRKSLAKAMEPGANYTEAILDFMMTPIESDEQGVKLIQRMPSKAPVKPAVDNSVQSMLDRIRSFK